MENNDLMAIQAMIGNIILGSLRAAFPKAEVVPKLTVKITADILDELQKANLLNVGVDKVGF